VVVTGLRLRLLGRGWRAGLGVGLIVAAATLRAPTTLGLRVIAPVTLAILVALVGGAGAISRTLALAISLALTLAAAPASLAPLALAAHLRQSRHRPDHDQS
jgi:hypothetical protein